MNPTIFPTKISSTCTGYVGDADKKITLAECSGTPPTTANVFQVGCKMIQTDAASGAVGTFVNTGTLALPVWSLTSSSANADPLMLKTVTKSLTAAQINGMYAASVEVIPAVAGKSIILDSFVFDLTGTATQFANGGVVNLQYDSTVNGAGTTLHADIAATVVQGATARVQTIRIPKDLSAIATTAITGKGVYIGNKTGAFDTGTGTANCIVHYHLI